MVRHVQIEVVDHVPAPIIAVGNSYPDGHFIAPHRHRRGQLLSGATGTVVMSSASGSWIMPPQHGMWIPPGTEHSVRAIGAVQMQSLYVEPSVATAMPQDAQVVSIRPFVRQLIMEALDVPVDYAEGTKASALMALIQHELFALEVLPLSVRFPDHTALAARCQQFLLRPQITETTDQWSDDLGMSRRAFTRLFREQTGTSFIAWRQQACLSYALQLLAAGASVTTVAMELGYENQAAFSTMFRKTLGVPPRLYLT